MPAAVRVLAELVVVVVGVLIALWVDNLNTAREDRFQESAYLLGILEDLRTDSIAFVRRRETAIRGLEVADRLLELHGESSSTASAVLSTLNFGGGGVGVGVCGLKQLMVTLLTAGSN